MRRKPSKRAEGKATARTDAAPMTLQPPLLVRMTAEQQQEALAALVELLLPVVRGAGAARAA
jgi:hypothetical protein